MGVGRYRFVLGISLFAFLGCGSDAASTQDAGSSGVAASAAGPVGPQTPPSTNGAEVESWLAKGDYKSWHCEAAPHPSRSPSPHNINRICSNTLTSAFTGKGERPVGSAGVKELYDATGTKITGYAVYLKTQANSDGGNNWYWYERVPLDSPAPHDANGVVADGYGNVGTAKSICVGCHVKAGMDAAHTPTPGASDQVFTSVP